MNIKQIYKTVLSVLFCGSLPLSASLAAGFVPPLPPEPTADFWSDAMAYVEYGGAWATAASSEASRIQSEVMNAAKGVSDLKDFDLKGMLFNKEKDKSNVATARTIKKSKIADITNEDSVAEAFRTLFLTYPDEAMFKKFPGAEEVVKQAYREKAVEFSNDTMIEMYIAVRQIDERMKQLKAEFDALSSCYVKGSGGSSSSCQGASATDEEIGIWSNYYKLNTIYDSMLKLTQELTALKAQYEVAQAIRSGIEPVMPEEENETEEMSFNYYHTESIAFAQLLAAKPVVSTVSSASESDTQEKTYGGFTITNRNAAAKKPNAALDIVTAQPNNLKSPFSGTGDQFIVLAEANNVYQILQQALQIHNLKQQMPEYRRVFEEHDKVRQLHRKSVEQLKRSEDCVVDYLGRYYSNPEKVWLGSGCHYSGLNIVCNTNRPVTSETLKNLLPGDALCTDDSGKICSNYGINSYASRGGFAGWLISAYKTAKAEKVLELGEDDFAVEMKEDRQDQSTDDIKDQEQKVLAEQRSGTADSSYIKPSNEEKSAEAVREQEMIAWQIGAEAAKALGHDMLSASPKWGGVKNKYPAWNDEKAFYDQYLAEKYNNMKLYIRDLDLSYYAIPMVIGMSNSLNGSMFLEWLATRNLKIGDIRDYNNRIMQHVYNALTNQKKSKKPKSNLEKIKQRAESEMNKLINSFNIEMVSLENKKASVYERLDESGIELNDLKKAYNVAFDTKQDAMANIDMQKQTVEISQARKAKSSGSSSNFERNAENEIENSNREISQAETDAQTVSNQIDHKRDEIDGLRLELEWENNNIDRAKSNYAANVATLEHKNYEDIQNAEAKRAVTTPNLSLWSDPYLQTVIRSEGVGDVRYEILKKLISAADDAIADVKARVMQRIEDGYQEIMAMGDARYNPDNLNKILAIHQRVIEDIRNPEITLSISDSLLSAALPAGSMRSIIDTTEKLLFKFLTEDLCPDDACYRADTAYFVGLNPKPQDFQAPKGPMDSATPPVREVFHFDTVDFDNVVKSDTWHTTGSEFLNFGQDVPQIWKMILLPNGFVEKDVDVMKILSAQEGNETLSGDVLMRGGAYPCSIGNYVIDFQNGSFYVMPSTGQARPCNELKSIRVSTSKADIYLTEKDKVLGKLGTPLNNRNVSELSLLLQYEQGLRFNKKIQDIVDYYEKLSNQTEPQEDVWEKIYKKALLTRNQFGNYLGFVEIEDRYQKGVDEMNVKLDEARKTLSEQLAKADYTPEPGFDLADQNTYDEIVDVLDKAKNKFVQQAASKMKGLQPLNSTLEEKLTKNKNILEALQLDTDELVQLSDNMAGDSELSEKIKRQKVDTEARSKYEAEANDEFQNQLKNFETPYCAIY